MKEFIEKAASVIFALITAFAWNWTTYFKDINIITEVEQRWIFGIITIVFLIQQIYLVLPRAGDRLSIEGKREVIEYHLQETLADYYDYIHERLIEEQLAGGTSRVVEPVLPIVRINLMVPTIRYRGLLGSYLRIYYFACPPGVTYNNEEQSLHWKKGQGACGTAWKEGQMGVFDSVDPRLRLPENSLTDKQKAVTGHVKSAISFPMYYNGVIVGVLNFDSEQNISETKFIDAAPIGRDCVDAVEGLFSEIGITE